MVIGVKAHWNYINKNDKYTIQTPPKMYDRNNDNIAPGVSVTTTLIKYSVIITVDSNIDSYI